MTRQKKEKRHNRNSFLQEPQAKRAYYGHYIVESGDARRLKQNMATDSRKNVWAQDAKSFEMVLPQCAFAMLFLGSCVTEIKNISEF